MWTSAERPEYKSSVEEDGVKRVVFSVMTADEIRRRSACEVESVDLYSAGEPVRGGLYDIRMGVVEYGQRCGTCKHGNKECPGHPGHIELAAPVFNPLFIEYIKKILRCVCFKCSRACFPANYTPLPLPGEQALTHASEQSVRVKDSCARCGSARPERLMWSKTSLSVFTYTVRGSHDENLQVSSTDIYAILSRVPDADCLLMGLVPARTRPESLLFKALPVTPVSVRPPHRSGGQRRDDDQVHKLADIIKSNRRVRANIESGADESTTLSSVNDLQLDIMQLIENSGSAGTQARMKATNRPLKSIASRLKGKDGRVRNNLMGKRVDFSARSVVTAEPNISIDEVGVPVRIAMVLTFPEVVHDGSIERLKKMVANGPRVYPGARMLRRDGTTFSLERPEPRVRMELRVGDIVERHLIDGDVVLFNRQPSLHRMSMMCHRVRVMPHDTLRLNVLVTEPYNADFDGDEVNIHLPQSLSTSIEIERLASVKSQIISPRHHRPIIGVVQDVALGIYLLTQDGVEIDANTAANICARCSEWMPSGPLGGKELFSQLLPSTLHGEMAGGTIVSNGELTRGCIGKSQFQQESCGILHSIFAEEGPDAAVSLLDHVQWMTCDWLMRRGHSMGAADIVVSSECEDECSQLTANATRQIVELLSNVHQSGFSNESSASDLEALERQIIALLDGARDSVAKLVIADGTARGSRLLNMVRARSKGNNKNVVQMAGILGQNLIDGWRMPPTMGDRTLPHFHRHDISADARGFIASSFRSGLQPHEFFFHAMAGREGLIDTAVKTADCGYLQRRFVKALEDLQIACDGSVRDAAHNIVSFQYGGDGMDACAIETQAVPSFGGGLEWIAQEFLLCKDDRAELEHVLSKDAFLRWDKLSEDGFTRLRDHFKDIVGDKHFLAKVMHRDGARLGCGNVAHAIGFARIVRKCSRVYNDSGVGSDLDVMAVLDHQNALVSELFWADEVGRTKRPHRILGAALVRCHLNPKRLIRGGVTMLALEEIVAQIRRRYYAGIVSPSEMVGIIAAQSIAEPSTQMTLNTFHQTGSSNKASVPRVKELVAVTKNPKTTQYSIKLLPGMSSSANFAGIVRDRVLCTHVRDLVQRTLMLCENGASIYDADQRLTSLEALFHDDGDADIGIAENAGDLSRVRFVLRIELDRHRMSEHAVSTLDVHTAIFSCIHGKVVATDESSEVLIVRATPDIELADNHDIVAELREMEERILDTRIKGVSGIRGCDIIAPESGADGVYDERRAEYSPEEAYTLEAVASASKLSDLVNICDIPGVDPHNTYGDNLWHTVEMFGIEAGRTLLLRELQGAYSDENTYADFRHIELLVDFITRRGVLTAITRHGVGATDAGPLTKCSFEQTVHKIVQAGMFGETDRMSGVSANVMMGQTTPCGTGSSQILWDVALSANLPDGESVRLVSSDAPGALDVSHISCFSPFADSTEAIPKVGEGFLPCPDPHA